jgi:hypothetical protein
MSPVAGWEEEEAAGGLVTESGGCGGGSPGKGQSHGGEGGMQLG